MFIHEAKLAVRLSHANIVQVFDLGQGAGRRERRRARRGRGADAYYIAMEYVHGLDLASCSRARAGSSSALPISMGVYVASEVAKGLDHAHRRRDEQMRPLGIVHRDVSPQNVLLSFEGEVKVTDFGIAKARGALGSGAGTDTQRARAPGQVRLHEPRAGARRERRRAQRPLLARHRALRVRRGGEPVQRADDVRDAAPRAGVRVPARRAASPRRPRRARRDPQDGDGASRPPTATPTPGGMYEALLAFLYAQGSRFGAHDLAEFLARFRDSTDRPRPPAPPAARRRGRAGHPRDERTPVEVPAVAPAVERARREEAALRGDRPRGRDGRAARGDRARHRAARAQTPAAVVDKAASHRRALGRARRSGASPGKSRRSSASGDPDGRDTEMATRCALVALRALDARARPAPACTRRIHVSRDGEPTEDERLGTLSTTARDLARVREGQRRDLERQAMRHDQAALRVRAADRGRPHRAGQRGRRRS